MRSVLSHTVGILSAVCVSMCVYTQCWMCVYIHLGVGMHYRLARHFQGSHSNTTSTLRPIQLAPCVHSQLAPMAAWSWSCPSSPPEVPSHVSTSHCVVQPHRKHWYCVVMNRHKTLVPVPSCGGNVERIGEKSDTSCSFREQLSCLFLLCEAKLFGHYANMCLRTLTVYPFCVM